MSRREVVTLGAQFVELEFYRFKRYGAPFSLILLCFEGSIPEELEEAVAIRIRRTDAVEMLTECTMMIILGHTGRGQAGLALKHLEPLVKSYGQNYHFATATAEADDKTVIDLIERTVESMGDFARCLEC